MRTITKEECLKVSGAGNEGPWGAGPFDNQFKDYSAWDAWDGKLSRPPNYSDFSTAMGEGALVGLYFGGPIGGLEGAMIGGGAYNIYDHFLK